MTILRRLLVCLVSVVFAAALPALAEPSVLFKDVRVFNGVDPTLTKANVLVEGQKIAKISSKAIKAPVGAIVIEGNNRVLSPGFIDLHSHLTFQAPKDELELHPYAVGAIAGKGGRALSDEWVHFHPRRRRHAPRYRTDYRARNDRRAALVSVGRGHQPDERPRRLPRTCYA